MSVDAGQTINFKIDTPSSAYHIDILRLGWYGGDGARLVATDILPTATLPADPARVPDDLHDRARSTAATGASRPPGRCRATPCPGIYIAHLVRDDSQDPGGDSQIPFVVRNDASHSDILVPTDDATWEAYNDYGGNSLYNCTVGCPPGNPGGYKAAYAVSYNRPFDGALHDRQRRVLPLVRRIPDGPVPRAQRLQRQLHRRCRPRQPRSPLLDHKLLLFSGHDEYWSGGRARERHGGPRRRRQPRVLHRATRSSGRPAGDRASTAPTRPIGR